MTAFVDLRSEDGTRGAHVYLVADSEATWRIRAEKYPDHHDGGLWFGGRVLWGYDQTYREAAEVLARRWVDDGELPQGQQ